MGFQKTNWVDSIKDTFGNIISKGTPLSAKNLNKIEDGIVDLTEQLAETARTSEVFLKSKGININDWDEPTRKAVLEAQGINVNYVLGTGNVKAMNTSFLQPRKNLFNKATRRVGYYTDSLDGLQKNDIPGYDSSDFMPVEGGSAYKLSHAGRWAEYDANGKFNVGHSSGELTAILNTNTKFARVSILQSNIDTFQFEKGTTTTSYDTFALVLKSSAGEPIEIIQKGSVTPELASFMAMLPGKNKFSPSTTIINGKIPDATIVANGVGGVSFLHPIEAGKSYVVSRQVPGTRFRAAYTNTDQLVSGTTPVYNYTVNDIGTSIALPANGDAKYILCYFWREADQGTFTTTGLENIKIQVEEGEIATPYEVWKNSYKLLSDFLPPIPADKKTINKIASILSDSLSGFNGTSPMGNRSRYPQADLLTDLNKMWWKRLLDTTGMKLGINESWAGSRVSWDGVTESSDIGVNKHMASDTRIGKLDDNGTPNVIFFYGATNDLGADVPIGNWDGTNLQTSNVNTISDAYSTALKKMQTAYPNAHIVCISPMYTTTYYPSNRLNSVVDRMKFIADFYGATFVDLRKCGITIYNQSTYLPDGIHPNAAGMELIYKYILSQVLSVLDA